MSRIKKRARRKANLPEPTYNDSLPITVKKKEIIDAISKNQVVIISGETGSGKTTQIPKFCLAAGRGIDGKIGCTQPRRIAATTVSHRIAEELGEKLGTSVGYKIRFQDKTNPNEYIKIMTDGILLAETQNDPLLSEYDTIIVDEAHERSLNIDFILGILKSLLKQRKDLKLIITSATIDTDKFSKAFDNAPVIEVSGRMYPVEVRYYPGDPETDGSGEQTHIEMAVSAVEKLQKESVVGDIIIFMPTEQDIRDTCELIEGSNYKQMILFPLFARLSASEQSRIFSTSSSRKIIVATNIAETSITIPGIKYVIDTGLARISRYNPKSRTTSLPVTNISKSSADQRKGRCGRVANGVCVRLYSEDDFNVRPPFTAPEILRSNLAEVILKMIAFKLGEISDFPFIDKPVSKSIKDGFDLLFELGAIVSTSDKKKSRTKSRFSLTAKGSIMANMPIDPRLSRMLIEAQAQGCLKYMEIIASALSIQDPRERPVEKSHEADQIHKTFHDPSSDFISLLNIWEHYHQTWRKEKTTGRMKKFCKTHHLSFRRMREWRDIHAQISKILKAYNLNDKHIKGVKGRTRQGVMSNISITEDSPLYTAIHQSILSGFLSNIAMKKEKNIFQAAKGKEAMIFPGSALFNHASPWIVSAEMVETSRLFARTCANINCEWLEALGKGLCKYTYLEPHWERSRGEVVASEQVSLFGLIIVPQRPVSYGRINPDEASEIFIQKALVQGDVKKKFDFMTYNQHLIDNITGMENRIRRRDILVSETELFAFYRKRLKGCYDVKTLSEMIKQKGSDRFLEMKQNDILRYYPDEKELSRYPDRIKVGDRHFDCVYRFEPGKTEDGVTIKIPSSFASMAPEESLEWIVPGLLKEKISALIKGLPKKFRKQLVPVSNTVDVIINEMLKTQSALTTALGEFIYNRFGIDIPASAWPDDMLPDYLKMRISITDSKGKELCSGRDTTILHQNIAVPSKPDPSDEIASVRRKWEISGITRWDFPDLSESIKISGKNRAKWLLYPALEVKDPKGKSVNLRLFQHGEKAAKSHKQGVCALFTLYFSKDLKFLKKALVLPKDMGKLSDYFGGAKQFENMLYERIVNDLFSKNIRSKDAFYSHAESVRPLIIPAGQNVLNQSRSILEAYHDTRTILFELENTNANNITANQFLCGLREELKRLVPEAFIHLYNQDRRVHLDRHIKTIAIRAQRALVNFEKDQAKAQKVLFFTDSLEKLIEELTVKSSKQKRKLIEDYFWLIEEYKVSLFAQELKTAVPVSKKRLEKRLKEIKRMK